MEKEQLNEELEVAQEQVKEEIKENPLSKELETLKKELEELKKPKVEEPEVSDGDLIPKSEHENYKKFHNEENKNLRLKSKQVEEENKALLQQFEDVKQLIIKDLPDDEVDFVNEIKSLKGLLLYVKKRDVKNSQSVPDTSQKSKPNGWYVPSKTIEYRR